MLGTIGLLLFGVARRFVSNAVALLMVFLFLSTPMVLLVTGSLLVENFVAAMTLAADGVMKSRNTVQRQS